MSHVSGKRVLATGGNRFLGRYVRDTDRPFVEAWGSGRRAGSSCTPRAQPTGSPGGRRYDDPNPVTLGNGTVITVKALAELLREMFGYRDELKLELTKPDCQPRRCLDTSRTRDRFRWTAKTSFRGGLAETIAWYYGHLTGGRRVNPRP